MTDRLKMVVWLAALLFCLPLLAQEGGDDEGDKDAEATEEPAVDDAAKKKQEEPAAAEEAKKEESTPAAAEEAKKEEPMPAAAEEAKKEEPMPAAAPAEGPKEEATVSAEVKEEGEQKKEEEKKEGKKYTIGLTNVLSQNVNADRPNFGYALTVNGSYTMPLEITLSASIGFAYNLAFARTREASFDDSGYVDSRTLNHYLFDGTPLQVEINRRFTIPTVEIGVTPSLGWSLPFTNRMLWEVYTQRSTLSPSVTVDRAFKLMEEMTLSLAYTCAYAYNFVEYDWAWDKYNNEPLDVNVQMAITNMLTVSWSFKKFSLRIGAGYESSLKYGELGQEDTIAKHQLWDHNVIFQGGASYNLQGFTENDNFTFGVGFTTAGPEFEDGNFVDASLPEKGAYPNYKKSAGYLTPFAGEYTKVSATIGYNYSF